MYLKIIFILGILANQVIAHKTNKISKNDWKPVQYGFETDHRRESQFDEVKPKDISENSGQFFTEITGTRSPYDKDIKELADRGLKSVKEQEMEDNYSNLKAMDSAVAPMTLKIPNNNFNKPFSYQFEIPNEKEQETEQAQHHHHHHQYQNQQPAQQPLQSHLKNNNYYREHTPHFEALTQAREEAAADNYYNPNQAAKPSSSGSNYNTGLEKTFRGPSTQHNNAHLQNYNQNGNNYSPVNDPVHNVHIQHYPGYTTESEHRPQLYNNDNIGNAPRFEALTASQPDEYQNGEERKKRKNSKGNYNNGSSSSYSYSNSCDDGECSSNKSSGSSERPSKSHKKRKHSRKHSDPEMGVLLNHKIYHDGDENSGSTHSSGESHNHSSYHNKHSSGNGKKSKKNRKHKRHHRPHRHHHHLSEDEREQYKLKNHPSEGSSYQVIEYPQESRINERIAEANDSQQIESPEKRHVDKNFKSKHHKSTRQPSKKSKFENSNATISDYDSTIVTPNSEYKFLINYNNKNDRSDDAQHDHQHPQQQQEDENEDAVKHKKIKKGRKNEKEIRYFQDIYLAKPEPRYIEYGHKMENPRYLEERFEENDRTKINQPPRFRGSVKWVNNDNDEQGQHVWDLGHLG